MGKTSLARRFVEGIFSEDYITTVGVKIDKKQIEVDGEAISLIPFVVIFSKSDLKNNWDVEEADIEGFEAIGWPVIRSSAKTGHGIEEAFRVLTTKMLEHK